MRIIRFVAIALALATMALFLPLRASTGWALTGSGAPPVNVIEQIQGTNTLKTDVRARRYYPRYSHAGRGYRNYGYRNYGHRNYAYRNHGYRNHGYRNYGRYNWRNHGPRYAYRYPGYNYYYGGFWYAAPWWNYGYANNYYDNDYYDGGYGGGDHVEWCLNRYRSYNPRTDTYMGYDGRRHYCRSPY